MTDAEVRNQAIKHFFSRAFYSNHPSPSKKTSYNLGKEKIYPLLKAFCEQHHFPCPRPRTIGRVIADAPDKMRMTPVRIRPTGKKIPYKRNTHHRFASMARIGCLATSIKNHDKFRVT